MNLTACKDTHGIAKGDYFYNYQSITDMSWDPRTLMTDNTNQSLHTTAVANLTVVALNATNNTEVIPSQSEHPFGRSSKINRTSPSGTVSTILMPVNSKTPFNDLGEQIYRLVDLLEDGKRRSIHQPMRDTIESIKMLYEVYRRQQLANKVPTVSRKLHPCLNPYTGAERKETSKLKSPRTLGTKTN